MIGKYLRPLVRWESALVVAIIAELIIFGSLNHRFIDPQRLLNSTTDFAYLGMLALPLAVIMLAGGIDISIGSMVSLSGIITGVAYLLSGSMVVGIVAGLAVGVIAGLINGILVVTTGTAPMVITLGTQFLFAGLALGVSGLGGVSAFEGISNLPEWFNDIAGTKILFGIPNLLVIFGIVSLIFWYLVAKTTFGRTIKLFGMNPRATTYVGINVKNLQLSMYALMGAMAGVVGILLTSYFGSARPDVGGTLLMPALTLVVIGGVSMFGGEGGMVGVILATFVIGFLEQGLRFAGMTENQVTVVTGLALVVVASLRWWTARGSELVANRRATKRTTPQALAPASA